MSDPHGIQVRADYNYALAPEPAIGDTNRHPSGERGAFGEERIQDGYNGLKRYYVRRKRYRCDKGHVFECETNHYSTIYHCPRCGPEHCDCIELELSNQIKRMEESDNEQ